MSDNTALPWTDNYLLGYPPMDDTHRVVPVPSGASRVKSTGVVYRLVILRLLGQAVRAGRELVVTSSVLVSGTTVRRHRARTSRPR